MGRAEARQADSGRKQPVFFAGSAAADGRFPSEISPNSGGTGGGNHRKAGGDAAAEKTSFNVVLKEAGDQKIKVIKVVRDATGLGLKEAKELVDGAPKTVKENVSKEEAEDLKAKFTEVGAVVELQ